MIRMQKLQNQRNRWVRVQGFPKDMTLEIRLEGHEKGRNHKVHNGYKMSDAAMWK